MNKGDDFCCDSHASTFPERKHPDFGHKQKGYGDVLPDHNRGAAHPMHHSRGKLRAQMNPDHGPHRGAGKHV